MGNCKILRFPNKINQQTGEYMREKINRLANGIIENDTPKISINPENIDIAVQYTQDANIQIDIISENNIPIKGLAYSNNPAVKILTAKFGGITAHVYAEIDSRYLGAKEHIEGEISLITNGGEYKIPYRFRTFGGLTGETLKKLKTIEDFMIIAKEDPETALRIFEYKDFTSASFMYDMKLRALYEGLTKRPDGYNCLEQFLVAAGAKMPVKLIFEKNRYEITYTDEENEYTIPIKRSGWGYFNIKVSSDSGFIKVKDKVIKDSDFDFNKYDCMLEFVASKLPRSNSSAVISFDSVDSYYEVVIDVKRKIAEKRPGKALMYKKHLLNYIKYRLRYEYEQNERLITMMLDELDKIYLITDNRLRIKLLKAEALYLKGEEYLARAVLLEEKDNVRAHKIDQHYEYILFEYVSLMLEEMAGQREFFVKQVRGLIKDGLYEYLPFLINTDTAFKNSSALMYEMFKEAFEAGVRSPFLYIHYCRLLNKNPDFMHEPSKLDLAALDFGSDARLLSERLISETALKMKKIKKFDKRTFILLKKLYIQSGADKELLSAICRLIIKSGIKDKSLHKWFELAVKEDIGNKQLLNDTAAYTQDDDNSVFEYFMHTVPYDYADLINEKVLTYFITHHHVLDANEKTILYGNIIKFTKKSDILYIKYLPQMKNFVFEQVSQLRINERLAVIYKDIIKPNMIDKRMAKYLITILSAYRIEIQSRLVKTAAVIYPELKGEHVYTFDKIHAYVPVFSDRAGIFLQDAQGNRYNSLNIKKQSLLDMPEVKKECERLYPEHLLFELAQIWKTLDKTDPEQQETALLQEAGKDANFSDLFKSRILSKLLEFYREDSKKPSGPDIWVIEDNYKFLLDINKKDLNESDRSMICETLINIGYAKEAYDMVMNYGYDIVTRYNLAKLCKIMILDNAFANEGLLRTSFHVVMEGYNDMAILEYLCKYFNGSTDDMFSLFEISVSEHINTYDLDERLIAQMMFTGNGTHLDQAFAWYVSRRKGNDVLIRAYFTVKSADYFLNGKELPKKVFEYLENAISSTHGTNEIPVIYKLATTKYYSELTYMGSERQAAASDIINSLIDKGLIFPYYKKLAKWIRLPQDIKDKEILIYYGNRFSLPKLKSRILPGDGEFKSDDLRRMYMDIFIKEKLLFSGDIWEYKVYEEEDGKEIIKDSGSIRHETETDDNLPSRFERLNKLDPSSGGMPDYVLKEKFEDYIVKDEISRNLFGLM